ncbi:MAG: hypothetical protein LBU32_20130 [Clostridiales bacterium]|nr:hypothetical protein [Clostridiales bacterium]
MPLVAALFRQRSILIVVGWAMGLKAAGPRNYPRRNASAAQGRRARHDVKCGGDSGVGGQKHYTAD